MPARDAESARHLQSWSQFQAPAKMEGPPLRRDHLDGDGRRKAGDGLSAGFHDSAENDVLPGGTSTGVMLIPAAGLAAVKLTPPLAPSLRSTPTTIGTSLPWRTSRTFPDGRLADSVKAAGVKVCFPIVAVPRMAGERTAI
jgi:hypothetical protein